MVVTGRGPMATKWMVWSHCNNVAFMLISGTSGFVSCTSLTMSGEVNTSPSSRSAASATNCQIGFPYFRPATDSYAALTVYNNCFSAREIEPKVMRGMAEDFGIDVAWQSEENGCLWTVKLK